MILLYYKYVVRRSRLETSGIISYPYLILESYFINFLFIYGFRLLWTENCYIVIHIYIYESAKG